MKKMILIFVVGLFAFFLNSCSGLDGENGIYEEYPALVLERHTKEPNERYIHRYLFYAYGPNLAVQLGHFETKGTVVFNGDSVNVYTYRYQVPRHVDSNEAVKFTPHSVRIKYLEDGLHFSLGDGPFQKIKDSKGTQRNYLQKRVLYSLEDKMNNEFEDYFETLIK